MTRNRWKCASPAGIVLNSVLCRDSVLKCVPSCSIQYIAYIMGPHKPVLEMELNAVCSTECGCKTETQISYWWRNLWLKYTVEDCSVPRDHTVTLTAYCHHITALLVSLAVVGKVWENSHHRPLCALTGITTIIITIQLVSLCHLGQSKEQLMSPSPELAK